MKAVAELGRGLWRISLSAPAVALWCTLWLFEPREKINQCSGPGRWYTLGGENLSVRLWGERRAAGATARAMLGPLVSMALN